MPSRPLTGDALADLPVTADGFVPIEDGRIAGHGPMASCPERADRIIEARGCAVLPGWCDSHTHPVFAKSRESAFVDRINGLSYEEIARRGGGILNSARKLAQTSEDELFESAYRRLNEIIRYGTVAVEIKSGYGLTVEGELKMLRVIRRLKEQSPIPIKATFLGAHAMPVEFRDNREGYLQLITDEMLPRIADQGLADFIDVFCERGFFTTNEAEHII